jgi:hypothetical protein
MTAEMPKCKITVLKRTIHQDLIDDYLAEVHIWLRPVIFKVERIDNPRSYPGQSHFGEDWDDAMWLAWGTTAP